ncbi:MAG: amidase family protein [Vicinamibacterales bacterium]|jgi:amidase|nr:glutamyl-tRNA amidotransferase [Acidobacteriota bacterium]MDP6373804.1 amidase family protein [Vicinamibacterales bacterium]MDP6607946.1 amidase family protein [Vicinamibacterales bacterium]
MQQSSGWYRRLASFALLISLSGAGGSGFAQPIDVTAATLEEVNRAFDAGTLTAEQLVSLYLARIAAFDKAGPTLNAVITLNPEALDRARALDAERRSQGPRSRLHGVPVVLKDNLDTGDMPTTAGSSLLRGSRPPDDAFIVQKLRDAGAIVLAKLNMSEFASGGAQSSLGGPMRNPHDLARSPAGSSGGTGIAVAAAYAQLGLGTDTGGSVRMPSTANGIVGLKPTHGLMSRDGVIPLALTFDMAGPMARHVYDVAAALGVMAGVDPADDATRKSEGQAHTDYTQYLDAGALDGARLGIARDFLGQDADVDWIVEASLAAMRDAGATIVDVQLPDWLLDANNALYTTIRHREFRAQIPEYLATLTAGYPATLADLVERATRLTAPTDAGVPNPGRWRLMEREDDSGELSDHEYEAVYAYGLPLIRTIVEGVMDANDLEALVYPTQPRRPTRLDSDPAPTASGGARRPSPIRFANLTGFPDLVVPAGFTGNRLPVGLSFLGRAFSEPQLLALGYAFEQATQARRLPIHTPALAAADSQPN